MAKAAKTNTVTPVVTLPTIKPTQVDLTPKQRDQWDTTRAMLMWHCPAFSHVFITMMARGRTMAVFTKDVPIAATDGSALMLNPDTFFNYTLQERVFIITHEILHCIYDHVGTMHQIQKRGEVAYPDGRKLPYDHGLMNKALDYVINDILVDARVGDLNKDWLHDPNIANRNDSGLEAYRKMYENNPPTEGNPFDVHLAPGSADGQDPGTAAGDRNDQEWKAQVAAGIAVAKAQGKLPQGLGRALGEVLEPKVDWREHIAALFARKLGEGRRDWRRADRRLIVRDIYAPGKSGFGTGTVVVAADTSGSIGEKELDMFFAEVAGLLEDVKPERLYLMWCDAEVHRVDELDEPGDLNSVRAKGAPGGGGTSFIPVFDKIAEMDIEPEAVVYLTDGYGTFPARAPKYHVIWGSTTPSDHIKYPWGEVVDVPKQAV